MPTLEYVIYYTTLDEPTKEHCVVFKSFNSSGILEAEVKRYLAEIDEIVDKITHVIPVNRETVAILSDGLQLHYDPVLSGYQV